MLNFPSIQQSQNSTEYQQAMEIISQNVANEFRILNELNTVYSWVVGFSRALISFISFSRILHILANYLFGIGGMHLIELNLNR